MPTSLTVSVTTSYLAKGLYISHIDFFYNGDSYDAKERSLPCRNLHVTLVDTIDERCSLLYPKYDSIVIVSCT